MKKPLRLEMINGAHAFFPASRREDPDWLNPKSLKAHPTSSSLRFDKQLEKPLWVGTCADDNISWVLDVFLDSLINPDEQQKLNDFASTIQAGNSERQITMSDPELSFIVNNMVNRHNFGQADSKTLNRYCRQYFRMKLRS